MTNEIRSEPLRSPEAEEALLLGALKAIDQATSTGTPVITWESGHIQEMPSHLLTPNVALVDLADEHLRWLANFDGQHRVNWLNLRDANYESAMTEAAVRRLLERQGVIVEPNVDLTGIRQSADFVCAVGPSRFYVEVKNISIAHAAEQTGTPNNAQGIYPLRPLNRAIFQALKSKAKQCGDLDAPALLAVGTWHGFAAMDTLRKPFINMLLTGNTRLLWTVERNGMSTHDPYLGTDLRDAAFLKPNNGAPGFARNSLSGLLLCGIGFEPAIVIGILHPNPARRFDRGLLPGVEFGSVEIDSKSHQLTVHWSPPA